MKKWAVLSLGVLCVSCSAIFVRMANVDGLVTAFYRVAIALAFVAPLYLAKRARAGRERGETPRNLALCLAGGLFFGLDLAFWNVAVMKSGATIPTVLVNLSSVWVAIGASFFLRQKPGPAHWAGTALALVGIVCIVGARGLVGLRLETGVSYSIIASLFLASYLLITTRARREMSSLSVLFYALLSSALFLLTVCLVAKRQLFGYSGRTWLALACIGLVVQAGGYLSINYSLGFLPARLVSLASLLQPLVTGLIAVFALGERLGPGKLLGGCIVLAGLSLSILDARGTASKPASSGHALP